MYLREVRCPRCEGRFVVDGSLWDAGVVRLRCPSCSHYFLPDGSPRNRSVRAVAGASVDIEIWEPEEGRQ